MRRGRRRLAFVAPAAAVVLVLVGAFVLGPLRSGHAAVSVPTRAADPGTAAWHDPEPALILTYDADDDQILSAGDRVYFLADAVDLFCEGDGATLLDTTVTGDVELTWDFDGVANCSATSGSDTAVYFVAP